MGFRKSSLRGVVPGTQGGLDPEARVRAGSARGVGLISIFFFFKGTSFLTLCFLLEGV